MNTAERIKTRRKSLGISPEDIAEAIGVSRATYYRYESDDIDNMSIAVLEPLAKILKCTPEYLMGWGENTSEKIFSLVKFFEDPVSAGMGTWLNDGYEYSYIDIKEKPTNADVALKVRGDSMEPMYNDDEVVLVKTNVVVEQGQIGIFILNGEGYLKQWQGNKLVSINPKYEPIFINEYDEFIIVGRVIGKLEKEEENQYGFI